MKSLDFLKEGFVEDASEAHQDHEVQMARQECFNTAENALALHKLLRNISEAQGLEGWVSSKITLANDYLKRVREYLEYEFLTKDINEITPQATIAENAEPKKKLIEYKIVSGQEGKSENYVITGLDTKTLDQLARAYYGAIKLEQDPKNPNVTTIVWDLPTAGPTQYGSYDASSGTANFIKKMTDAGDQLAKSVKKIDQVVEEGSDLDQQAMSVADKLTSGKNLEKLQTMRHDSTVYRALDRYFAKNNIPENIYNRVANIVFKRINTQGVAEARVTQLPTQGADYSKYDTDHLKMLLRPGILHRNEARFKALIRKELQKREQQGQQGVTEGKKCNHTMEGTQCPVHGLSECPMQENKKLKETTAGSVAGVNNPPGKNSGKKKSQIGSLFGGTYKQPVHETDFAGEKTTPPQKPGDQVRGTEKAVKKGKQQPFYHRLVGNE
jgi:hypothetical protein